MVAVQEVAAREMQWHVRQQLVEQGRKLIYEGNRTGTALLKLAFRFEDPEMRRHVRHVAGHRRPTDVGRRTGHCPFRPQ
ncbi:hypothetical protein ACFU8W_49515 [Streptomyces sp. NPDC057565]|uniref:hypothetical protein n=1 Tax=Streptomyces sp. NPDC057565 TaxID=3346169 RepID=UPI0036A3DB8A